MGGCVSARRRKEPIYLDLLSEELQISLWNYRYFKSNQLKFNVTNYENCPCFVIGVDKTEYRKSPKISLTKTILTKEMLEISNLYSTNTYQTYDILAGTTRETTDIVYSIKNGQYVLLKCSHVEQNQKYSSLNSKLCKTRIQLSALYVLDIYGDCIFYITANPYHFKPYFSYDMMY